ncbi:hypothetical protein [Niabella hibiscisoli]|uniref:hypothetical protein n=1 Tax=Niabella hibiscisoli TaxID=1825928 RepID=UPI001F0D25DA|nr:hypothetical protein [Niabella hibiscisoli]MCH5715381.1 hypothetical protein [Niabella hibiscisoli]
MPGGKIVANLINNGFMIIDSVQKNLNITPILKMIRLAFHPTWYTSPLLITRIIYGWVLKAAVLAS